MRLLNNKIIGVPLENPEKQGLIYIPTTARSQGVAIPIKVLFVGSQFKYKQEVKVGDIVFASKYFGDELPVGMFLEKGARLYAGEDVIAKVE